MIDKRTLIAALRARLAEELATMKRLAVDAAEAATHEDNKPENDKDMRSTEASYVARGQAGRARDIERDLALLGAMEPREFAPGEAIAISALVELRQGGGATTVCLLVPAGGGQRVRLDGVEVQAVTSTSPLGAALLGLVEGDDAEVRTPQGTKLYEVARVR
jgi:transcription elongation GreA/GreB family factor